MECFAAEERIMRLGILGGTFDPIHLGHLHIAQAAADEFSLPRVLLMPSCISYLKAGKQITPAGIRLEMVRAAATADDRFICDDMEIKRGGNSYTCETVRGLEERYDALCDFYYIIGADTLLSIHTWREFETILKRCILTVASRDGADDPMRERAELLSEKYGARIKFLSCPEADISSTKIRAMTASGEDISSLVPGTVLEIIKANKLYVR